MVTPADPPHPASELLAIASSLRELVEWDAEDGLPGYPHPVAPRPTTPPAEESPAPPTAPPAEESLPPTRQPRPALDALRAELGECTRCKLSGLGRSTIVFGEGNPQADLLFAGEGPGYNEDRTGRPFVGRGGELLDRMINAMGLQRSDVYICNVVKCRPPNNRDPEPDEVIACQPFLRAQVRSIQPRVIVTLGRFASQCLLGSTDSMGRLRGRFQDYYGAKLMPTYHPAYLLRNPADKRLAWQDLQMVMAELGLTRGGGG